jgi:hypothetical protein
VEFTGIGNAEIRERIPDLNQNLGAGDVHALVDVIGRLVRHAPERLERRAKASDAEVG